MEENSKPKKKKKFKAKKVLCNVLDPGTIRRFQHNSAAWRKNMALEVLQYGSRDKNHSKHISSRRTCYKKQLKGQVFEHVTDMFLETEFLLQTMEV